MKAILKKLGAIQKEIGKMEKDGMNAFQNYKYLSETQITLKMKKLFDKHGVMFIPTSEILSSYEISPTSKGAKQFVTNVRVAYVFADIETGEKLEGRFDGQGSDTADKGVYKAITGAIKYVFMKTFNIPTGDDPEKDGVNTKKAPNFADDKMSQLAKENKLQCTACGSIDIKISQKTGRPYCPNAYKDQNHPKQYEVKQTTASLPVEPELNF
jgi:hypothetical protein